MLTILDPAQLDPVAYDGGLIERIGRHSLLDGGRMGWNYCMDYTWVAMRCDGLLSGGMKAVDIGCGPGAIHGYLEDRHGVDILGVDMHRWERDYVDAVGDFRDEGFRRSVGLLPGTVDVILAVSALEHNPPPVHRELVDICLSCLKPGGSLISTFSVSPLWTAKTDNQWNLSRRLAEETYRDRFDSFPYREVRKRWRGHREMPRLYRERYGRWNLLSPAFLSAGAHVVRPGGRP